MADEAGATSTIDIQRVIDVRILALEDLAKDAAANAQAWAKDNKQWTDRTGDAKNSIEGVVIKPNEPTQINKGIGKNGVSGVMDSVNAVGFGVAHGVNYGKWLEEANDGRYAILKPAVDHFRSDFLNNAKRIIGATT
jgi:hypothetical protein